jgi:hypothetical protein
MHELWYLLPPIGSIFTEEKKLKFTNKFPVSNHYASLWFDLENKQG